MQGEVHYHHSRTEQATGAVPKRARHICCWNEINASTIQHYEEDICKYKKCGDYEKLTLAYLQLSDLYRSGGDMVSAIANLKEKLKLDSEQQKAKTLEQLVELSYSSSKLYQAAYFAYQLARLYEGTGLYLQALGVYKHSNYLFEQSGESAWGYIQRNNISISFTHFKAENYLEAARGFENGAYIILQRNKLRGMCARYMIFAFFALLLNRDRVLIEEVPLRYELIFGSIMQEFMSHRQICEYWSNMNYDPHPFAQLARLYVGTDNWDFIEQAVIAALPEEEQAAVKALCDSEKGEKPELREEAPSQQTVYDCAIRKSQ